MTIRVFNIELILLILACSSNILSFTIAERSTELGHRGNFRYSYVFMTAENKDTKQRVTTCVNYQQYRMKTTPSTLVAEDFDSAQPFILKFWRGLNNNTRICPLPREPGLQETYYNEIVPLEYRIDDDGSSCTRSFVNGQTSFRNASQFSVDTLAEHHASVALLILDRGRQFVQNWKDYLFSNFQDPTLRNNSLPTFFIYRTDLYQKIMSIMDSVAIAEDRIEIRFHRPSDGAFDNSMVVIWLIAMTCVTGGGLWAHHRHRAGKDVSIVSASKIDDDSENERPRTFLDRWGNTVTIVVMMTALCSVLLIGYYFRSFSVFFFNILLVVFGTVSIHGCIQALFSNFSFSTHRWYRAKMELMFSGRTFQITYSSATIGILSFSFCALWYVFRRHPYAFIPLDIINMALCLHVLKCLRLPSLKWISVLMVCMFCYDAFMVFGTPHITSNGCSIMLEVATGIAGCSKNEDKSSQPGYPVPPIEKQDETPEKFPMLMQVPHMNVMNECLDMEVELTYQTAILGLGDIVMPGYLIAHCFTMNGFSERRRLLYGFISILGYGVGLVATFTALAIYNVAQPALIYLVPFTLTPICVTAVLLGDFRRIWHGVPPESSLLRKEQSSPISELDEVAKNGLQDANGPASTSSDDTKNEPVNV